MNDDERYGGDADESRAAGFEMQEEGPGERGGFDPTPYVRQLRGRGGAQDYLDVKFRLLWLRREHPNAEIVTDHIRIDERVAIFKATVTIPDGGKATGHGSETAGDFPDFIEKAETKALGRALNALGYGAQFVEGEEPAATPEPRPTPVRPEPPPEPRASPPAATAEPRPAPPTPIPARPAAPERRAATPPARPVSVDSPTARERAASPPPTPFPTSSASRVTPAAADDDEPSLEDYSWTAFWKWAREIGFDSKPAVEAYLGQSIGNLNPLDVRRQVLAKRTEGA